MITKEEAKEKIANKLKLAVKYQIGTTEYTVDKIFKQKYKDKYKHIEIICRHDDKETIIDAEEYLIKSFVDDHRCKNNNKQTTLTNKSDEYAEYTIYLVWA